MRKWLLLAGVLTVIAAIGGRSSAQGPAVTFHGIGDLPGGGATTVIKDATRVGGVIYAVGGAVTRVVCPSGPPLNLPGPCANTDTAILWRSDGSPIQALNDITSTSANPPIIATAITADGLHIASQARDLNTSTIPPSSIIRAVRVDSSSLANLNLSAFAPALTVSAGAVAISTAPPRYHLVGRRPR